MNLIVGFYARVMADDSLRPFFEDLDMDAQSRKMIAFMAHASEGPEEYRGRGLREAHRDLALEDSHFDAIATHLRAELQSLDVDDALIARVIALVESTRAEVLNR